MSDYACFRMCVNRAELYLWLAYRDLLLYLSLSERERARERERVGLMKKLNIVTHRILWK